MSRIYQSLEQIFKFRILSNAEIPTYLKRMSGMGKIDDVKRLELMSLILTRLGELEDQEVKTTTYTIKDVLDEADIAPVSSDDIKLYAHDDVLSGRVATLSTERPVETFKCSECGMVAKSKLGLISHSRKHKKSV